MAELLPYTDGTDRLTDYVFLILSRLKSVRETELIPQDRKLLRYVQRTGDLGPVVAEAFKLMSGDLHEGDDVADFGDGRARALDQEDAIKLVKEHGSIRLAAINTGISKSALQRAHSGEYRDYTARKAA